MQVEGVGSSFFGSATTFYTTHDYPSPTYTTPSFLFSGSDGSDGISFPRAGVYLLQFLLGTVSPLNAVDVVSNSVLSGVTLLSSSSNASSSSSVGEYVSYAVVSSLATGLITFPNQTALLDLYGSDWGGCYCYEVSVTLLY